MRQLFSSLLLTLAIACSCDRNEDILDNPFPDYSDLTGLTHGMIEIGEKLEDPYTVENMTKALKSLYPTKASDVALLAPTDIYVRFLPANEAQYMLLCKACPNLSDHPLDYEIVREGDYYQDPSIPEGEYTWMYAVLPSDTVLPKGVRAEILDRCYIPDNLKTTRVDPGFPDIDWAAVEMESFRLTGNENMLDRRGGTKSAPSGPCGRIAVVDEHFNSGRPCGVSGVKISANVFVNTCSCTTDDEGYYSMEKRFSSSPRYRIIFANEEGFSIGMNLVLFPASVSTLGKASAEGVSVLIDKNSDYYLFYRSALNNAACDYYRLCRENGIELPPSDMRFWLVRFLPSSSCCMLHHGAVLDNDLLKEYLGDCSAILKYLLPDITIGMSEVKDFYTVYSLVNHELAHASHFSVVGRDYWDRYTEFIVRSFVTSGWKAYGNGNENNSGYCEVGEMWAYHLENAVHARRYPGHVWNAGSNFWFKPQIFDMLVRRGLTSAKLFKALQKEVCTKELLCDKLLELYPEFREDIKETFLRY